jgi:HD-like signal output (HDOD) protein
MNGGQNAQPLTDAPSDTQARFIAELEDEIAKGELDLPGIPDIAVRVRAALEDNEVTAEQLAVIVGSEPVLAGRIVQLANSAALNASGKRIAELRTAIARTGFSLVRNTAIAYAISQLRNHRELKNLAQPLSVLWSRCTLVAAMCRVMAPRISRVNPDTAMLAGLLHGVGELYLLTRLKRHEKLFRNDAAYRSIIRAWHARCAKMILETWAMDASIVQAISEFEQFDRVNDGPIDLTDVLTVSYLLAAYQAHPASLEINMNDVGVCRRLELSREEYESFIRESREEIAALRDVLDS